jgi:hypothetical protein
MALELKNELKMYFKSAREHGSLHGFQPLLANASARLFRSSARLGDW